VGRFRDSASLVVSVAVIAMPIVSATAMVTVSTMPAMAAFSGFIAGGGIDWYGDSRRLQRSPQASILLPILQEMLLRGIRLVAVRTVLGSCQVNGVAIFLQLFAKLLQMIELFLLVGCNGAAVPRSFCLRTELRRG